MERGDFLNLLYLLDKYCRRKADCDSAFNKYRSSRYYYINTLVFGRIGHTPFFSNVFQRSKILKETFTICQNTFPEIQ